jgi:arginase
MKRNVQIISAPSILGLKPNGVEKLPVSLLATGLADRMGLTTPVIHVPTKNTRYSFTRDQETKCLNPSPILDFSLILMEQISVLIAAGTFPLVLGGDCSILLGIMPALKTQVKSGLIFFDAHADFYLPPQSPTGEVADMELSLITGRGPEILTNIRGMKPYVEDKHVLHIAQRDADETKKYGSQDIRDSSIQCLDMRSIELAGRDKTTDQILRFIQRSDRESFWVHFDTDVLNDTENPAVDYRLPGGLLVADAQHMFRSIMATNRVAGMSVTIFNPDLDPDNRVAERISGCLVQALGGGGQNQ